MPPYNTTAIRELLRVAFDDEELTIFCYEHFRSVYDRFASGMSRLWKIQLLIEHCERYDRLDELLNEIRGVNPRQYENFIPLIREPAQITTIEDISFDKAQVEIILKGDLPDFTHEQLSAEIRDLLANILNIHHTHVSILAINRGSIILELEMPEKAVKQLIALYEANDPIIQDLGIERVRIIQRPLPPLTFLTHLYRYIMWEQSTPWMVLSYAFAAVIAGGFFWNLLSRLLRLPHHMGGSGNEPHGFYAFIWGFITILPVILFACLAYRKYTLSSWTSTFKWFAIILVYAIFGGLGAVLFYDFGFRSHIETLKRGYEEQELIIIILWSCILSISTYLSFLVLYPISKHLVNIWYPSIQILFSVLLSISAVIIFLLVAEPTPTFDQVRGLYAGFALRLGLFLGLIISISIKPFMNKYKS